MTIKLEDMTTAELLRAFRRSRWLAIEAQRFNESARAAVSLRNAATLANLLVARGEQLPY